MIIYDPRRKGGFSSLFGVTGSALFNWNSLPFGIISGLIAFICSEIPPISTFITQFTTFQSAYFGGLSFIVSFVVVYRAQLAIKRYNNAQSTYFKMCSKIADIAMFISVWIERESESLSEEVKTSQQNLAKCLIRWLQLYQELGTEEIQGFEFSPRYPRTSLTTEEAFLLSKVGKRPLIVMGWVLDSVARNKVSFICEAPMLTRMYALASEANLYFNETRRISETPFPFPFAQITMMMISFWAITTPAVVAHAFAGSYVGGAIVAFFGTWVLFAVNEAASQLEQPFDDADNDLPILYYSLSFQDQLSSILHMKCPSVTESSALYRRYSETKTTETERYDFSRIDAFTNLGKACTVRREFNERKNRRRKSLNGLNLTAKKLTEEISKTVSDVLPLKANNTSLPRPKPSSSQNNLFNLFNIPESSVANDSARMDIEEGIKPQEDNSVQNFLQTQNEDENFQQIKLEKQQESKPPSVVRKTSEDNLITAERSVSCRDLDEEKHLERTFSAPYDSAGLSVYHTLHKAAFNKEHEQKHHIMNDLKHSLHLGSSRLNSSRRLSGTDLACNKPPCVDTDILPVANTLNGASGKQMLDAFKHELRNNWRDVPLPHGDDVLLNESRRLYTTQTQRDNRQSGYFDFFTNIFTSANHSKSKLQVDERSPFSLLRRQGIFDRVR